jgi:gliding motility-associated-like protein
MKRINIIIILITILSHSTFGQGDSEKVWVTINNFSDLPLLERSPLKSSNAEFQELIEAFDIIGVEQALPDSRNDELQKVYEVECNCNVYELMAKMNQSSTLFSRAEEAPKYELLVTPNDYNIAFPVDYALDNIDAQGAWDYSTGDTNIILGVSDGNFYISHPELQNKYVGINTWTTPTNYYYHGTAVATTVAGATNNGMGKSAIGHDCKLDLAGMGYNSIIQLSNSGVRAINISWTSGCAYNSYVQMVINEAHNNGTILVAAAGNGSTCGGPSNLVYPAACNHVIAVTSVGPNDNHERFIGNPASTHQHNSSVDICAPGYDVALTVATGWYLTSNGTSFAAPYVTGTIGLMLSLNPCLTSEEVEEILKITEDGIDYLNPNYIGGLGAGRLNAKAAVEYVAQNMIVASANDISCFGLNDGSITLTNTLGAMNSYSWSSTDGSGLITSNDNQTGLSGGTYDVVITDSNGCSISQSVTLIEPTKLISTIAVSSYSGGVNISCNGLSDATIDFDITGGKPDYSYSWSTIDGSGVSPASQDQNGLSPGTYLITVTDSAGCFVTDSVTLVGPTLLSVSSALSTFPSADNISCNGLSDGSIDLTIMGGVSGYTYIWNTIDGSGLISTDEDQTGLAAGTYTVITEDNNGCKTTTTFTMIEPTLLTANINALSDYSGFAISCSGQSDGEIIGEIQGGSPGYNSVWNTTPANTGLLLTGLSEGIYTMTTIDTNGCVAIATEEVFGNSLPLLHPDPEMEICLGETVTFSSNVSLTEMCTWVLSNGMVLNQSGQNVLYLDEPGCIDAQLYVTNNLGCTDSVFLSNYICINANPIANFSASSNNVSTVDNLVSFESQSSGTSYCEWDFGDGTIANGENVNHSYGSNPPGEYSVVLFAYNDKGCFDSTSQVINIRDELIFNVPNSFTPNGDEFNNVFKPVFGSGFSPEDYSLIVYNRWGETIFHSQDLFNGWDGTYNGGAAQQGTYSWTMILKASDEAFNSNMKNTYQGHVNLLR